MENEQNNKCSLKLYREKVEPKLKEIDTFLKSKDTYSPEEISEILEINLKEVLILISFFNIKKIDKKNFILIMKNGSSFICKLFKRELECGSPALYSAKDIAYIYNLDYIKVEKAFEFLALDKVNSSQIKLILAQII